MQQLFSALLGFFFGIFARFIYDWNLDRKEANTIRQSLLLEILYMHEPTQRLQLDKYSQHYEKGRFEREDLFDSFWRPKYSTKIYESHTAKIDRLLGSDLCLQLHYYYWLIEKINERNCEDDSVVTDAFAMNLLTAVAHAYAMGIGSTEALMGKREARQAMRANLQSLIHEFEDEQHRQYIAQLLKKYKQKGAADALIRMSPTRQLKRLLHRWLSK